TVATENLLALIFMDFHDTALPEIEMREGDLIAPRGRRRP
ncbi:MAG: hypothetical protein RL320_1785, partial [Pseudomonadota bacterium]